MATAVCVLRGRGACMGIFGIFWDFLGGLLVRHVIPRGFAVPLCGLARAQSCRRGSATGRFTARVKPAKKSGGETRRVSRRTHGQVCEGFLRDPSLKRSGNAPDRYLAFFCQAFFSAEKKAVIFWIFWIFLLFWQRFCHLAVLFWWVRGNLLRRRWFFSCQFFQF